MGTSESVPTPFILEGYVPCAVAAGRLHSVSAKLRSVMMNSRPLFGLVLLDDPG